MEGEKGAENDDMIRLTSQRTSSSMGKNGGSEEKLRHSKQITGWVYIRESREIDRFCEFQANVAYLWPA